MSETDTALALAAKAEQCLENRENYMATHEGEAVAGVGYALLALLEQLSNGVVWTRSGDVI